MRLFRRISLLGVIGVVLFLAGAMDSPGVLSGQNPCPANSAKDFIQEMNLLPSIGEFELLSITDFSLGVINALEIPVAPGIDRSVDVAPFPMRETSFQMKLNGGPFTSTLSSTERTFRGVIDGVPDSFVALYIQPDRDLDGDGQNEPGFVSGFLVENLTTGVPWYFIEPVRPLLKPLATSPVVLAGIDACFPATSHTHIVYKAADMSPTTALATYLHPGKPQQIERTLGQQGPQAGVFSIDLDPARRVKPTIIQLRAPQCTAPGLTTIQSVVANRTDPPKNLTEVKVQLFIDNVPQGPAQAIPLIPSGGQDPVLFTHTFDSLGKFIIEVRTEASGMKRPIQITPMGDCPSSPFTSLPIVAVADAAFYEFYTTDIEEKAWWEGQEEVLNLVDAFYQEQFPGLAFKTRALEAWTPASSVPAVVPASGINAYTLLCLFAQGNLPSASASTVVPPPAIPHTGEDDVPMITHLFSGYDLGHIPPPMAIADSGCCWCEANCSGIGTNIVGLAEGTGGFRNHPSRSCITSSLDKPVDLIPAANHGLSRHYPILETPESNDPNANFQVTLYQRFLLVAHEIGHNLGANHKEDETGIMHPSLQGTIRFRFNSDSLEEIENCWLSCEN